MDQAKLVITLRSGKVIEKPILEPCENDDESISEGKEGVESDHCKEKIDSPQRKGKLITTLKSLKLSNR